MKVITSLILLFMLSIDAQACSPVGSKPYDLFVDLSESIYVGKAVKDESIKPDINTKKDHLGRELGIKSNWPYTLFTIEVKETLKGDEKEKIMVRIYDQCNQGSIYLNKEIIIYRNDKIDRVSRFHEPRYTKIKQQISAKAKQRTP